MEAAARDNLVRHRPGDARGHVESFFLKANAPDRPLAFWIKFTILSPAGRPQEAVGEVWAIVFDRALGPPLAVKETFSLAECALGRTAPGFSTSRAALGPLSTRGAIGAAGREIAWDLVFDEGAPPLHLFPCEALYETETFPRSKLLTPHPDSRFDGALCVGGREIAVRGWRGCQGHNWGRSHAHRYAWAHVDAFDGAEGTYFEGFSAQVKIGPLTTPPLTLLALVHGGRTYDFRGIAHWLNRSVELAPGRWTFFARSRTARLRGEVVADSRETAGLIYEDPSGEKAHCLNSKLARCRLDLEIAAGKRFEPVATLETAHRAALEVLVRGEAHGVPIIA